MRASSAAAVPHQMSRFEDCYYLEKSYFVTHLSARRKMLVVGVAAAHDLFRNHHRSNKHAEADWKSH